jgi:hypothetical protein
VRGSPSDTVPLIVAPGYSMTGVNAFMTGLLRHWLQLAAVASVVADPPRTAANAGTLTVECVTPMSVPFRCSVVRLCIRADVERSQGRLRCYSSVSRKADDGLPQQLSVGRRGDARSWLNPRRHLLARVAKSRRAKRIARSHPAQPEVANSIVTFGLALFLDRS